MIELNCNGSLSIKARCYYGLPDVELEERVATWTPLTSHESLSYSRLFLSLKKTSVRLNLGNTALHASNDIKRVEGKKNEGG